MSCHRITVDVVTYSHPHSCLLTFDQRLSHIRYHASSPCSCSFRFAHLHSLFLPRYHMNIIIIIHTRLRKHNPLPQSTPIHDPFISTLHTAYVTNGLPYNVLGRPLSVLATVQLFIISLPGLFSFSFSYLWLLSVSI